MNPERWHQVKQILADVILLDPAERSTSLDRVCGADLELREELRSLLSSHEQAGTGFLEDPAVQSVYVPPPTRAGRRIGAYQVVSEIGRGGMGEVYRAVRADGQFTKDVAIKLVGGGLDSTLVRERFRNERQILASLHHPNIAQLLDGGTTEEGVPYLVMELIEGEPIDAYCNARGLRIADRLQLFRLVCGAVHYAHQHLVIHRDIKPGNILVTNDGVPKLLDFGIAKLVESGGKSGETLNQALTPEYASPEQIRGESITTATDVYSLGVVLYRLLTGRSPYAVETRTPLQLAQVVCEKDPERPSTAVGRPPGKNESEQLQSPAKLRRELAGDLDNITLKALRKEPERRYASVEQFSEDIRRHLEGRPAIATPDSFLYRSRKFVLRNRFGVGAAVVLALAIVGGMLATARETRIARQQAEIAKTQKARAEKRFNDVRELSDSLIFEVHDAIQNLPGATPARKLLLERALNYLDSVSKDTDGDPDLERELAWGYQRIAVVQGSSAESNLGDAEGSIDSDRKSLRLFEAVAQANPKNIIDQLNVAMMHRILSYSALTEPSGRRDLQQAMAITERLLEIDPTNPKVRSERGVEYQNLGLMHDAAGERALALDAFQKNLDFKRNLLKTNPEYRRIRRSTGMGFVIFGSALARTGNRDEGLKNVAEGISFYETQQPGDDVINSQRELAVAREKRGDILLMDGKAKEALQVYQQSSSALQPMAKADPLNILLQLDLASTDYQQGRALGAAGRLSEALQKLQSAVTIFEKYNTTKATDDSPHGVGAIYIWVGDVVAGQGDYQRGLQYYTKGVASFGTTPPYPGDDDIRCELATGYTKTGNALRQLGRYGDASAAYKKALEVLNPSLAIQNQDVPALYVVGEAQEGLGDVAAALARQTHTPDQRSRLANEAQAFYQQSATTWREVKNPSRIAPSGFLSRGPRRPGQRTLTP